MVSAKPVQFNTTISICVKNYDIIIANLPWSDLTVPHSAPAILKGIAESHGYSVKTIDFNLDLYEKICKKNTQTYFKLEDYFVSFNSERNKLLDRFYNHVINTLKKFNFRYFGISVFAIITQKATFELCQRLRKEMPDVKIVLGGKGLNVYSHIAMHPYITETEKTLKFDKIMAEKNLADYFIIGDAEDAIIDLLSGKLDDRPNLLSNWFVPLKDNLEYPFANFDDYELKKYFGKKDEVQIPIISSKGCVRRCDFCDVPSQFKKFQSKNGKRMAEELLFLSQKYNATKFTMADSIANGNLKSLKEFAEIIAKYNKEVDDEKKIKWSSNWIHRPVGQLSEEVFKLIAESGAEHFTVGAEHFSDKVLKHMAKKTNMAGLFYELDLFRKYNVKCGLNNIIAHWSEDYDSFMEHIDNLIRLGPYFARETIDYIHISLFYIMKNTPAAQNKDVTGLTMLRDDFSLSWWTDKNPNLTIKPRLARFYFILTLIKYLNLPLDMKSISIKNYMYRIKEILPEAMQLFDSCINKKDHKECKILSSLDNINIYIDNKIKEFFPESTLKLNVTANSYKGDPELFVKINQEIVYKTLLSQGNHEIEIPFNYDFNQKNQVVIGMNNKRKFDTKVDSNGTILQDKNIILNELKIDDIDIVQYPKFFNTQGKFVVEGKAAEPHYGLWKNSTIQFEFDAPFWKYFQKSKDDIWFLDKDKDKFDQRLEEFKKFFNEIEY